MDVGDQVYKEHLTIKELPHRGGPAVARGSRLPRVLNQQSAKRLLEDNGWEETLGGKHVVKMEKPGRRPITLPKHRGHDYSRDLTDRILRQAGLKGTGT